MRKSKPATPVFAGTLACTLLLAACSQEQPATPNAAQSSVTIIEEYTPGLAAQMKDMQYWTHKLALSIEAENTELADFYHHELEEAVEDLTGSIDTYDGFPIAQLTTAMLLPALENLENELDSGDWSAVRESFSSVIASCNSCHQATAHGYIRITEAYGNNPFNQSFAP